eukprot:TRINITY_DN65654_c0_g1_i1.p1 TRINITY_DN65654_c0_g1~~TRINITY_DN65654_c0_g1_i1.p1  ORF type:complete len:379 (+),score=74.65 TRINITY_DN65654_c0_g1_i1:58-1194(+)
MTLQNAGPACLQPPPCQWEMCGLRTTDAEIGIMKHLEAILQRRAEDYSQLTAWASTFASPPASGDINEHCGLFWDDALHAKVACLDTRVPGPAAEHLPMPSFRTETEKLQLAQKMQQRPRKLCNKVIPGKETVAVKTHQAQGEGLPRFGDIDAELEAALRPILERILVKSTGKEGKGSWWKNMQVPKFCPLTCFPISLLPYPPFRLRVEDGQSISQCLVDGKILAMQLTLTGEHVAFGQRLHDADIDALDAYLNRCKLGQYSPKLAAALRDMAWHGASAEERKEASRKLKSHIAQVRFELGKQRRIQENRILQIAEVLPAQMQAKLSSFRQSLQKKQDLSLKSSPCNIRSSSDVSRMSSMSTHASFSSGSSDASTRSG